MSILLYINIPILKDDDDQDEAEKDDEVNTDRCNDSNMTTDVTGIMTHNQDNSIKV